MQTYLINLTVPSGFITPWQADTIFGHLCWAAERHEGFKNFKDAAGLIGLFRSLNPPFILSDGFPAGLLPAPITLKNCYQPESHNNINSDQYALMKRAKKEEWLTLEQFRIFQRGGIPVLSDRHKGFVATTSLHNQINRLTNTTGHMGSLFELDEKFVAPGSVQIYVKVQDGFADDVRLLFEYLAEAGYGAKRSAGKGMCRMDGFQTFDGFELTAANSRVESKTRGFVSLSHFVPAKNDPTDGAYQIMVKYGKLGEEKTYSGQPFKKPLIMIKPGAVFKFEGLSPFYGRLVEDISYADHSVVQYGFAFPVYLTAA